MANNVPGELSERELEILRLVATGASNKEIAQTLYISSNTVKVHLRNIFTKIGVASRTEAAMYAVRIGLVKTSTVKVAGDEETGPTSLPVQPPAPAPQTLSPVQALLQKWGILIMLVMILAALGIGILLAQLPFIQEALPGKTAVIQVMPSPTPLQRWKEHPSLPTARSALALAAYENYIYAIGGENDQGVTGMVERYEPDLNEWTTLKPKPVAVSEINAVVLGGKIYVPGGRMNTGEITNLFEVYDPAKNDWEAHASLPTARSGYALIAYEGRIYLFGGWDGKAYVNTVYVYDPGLDEWQTRTPMPTARGLCGAAISGGQIFVVGGTNGNEALTTSEVYNPSRDNSIDTPWQPGPELPEPRYSMGIASATDLIYLIGGRGKLSQDLSILVYSPTTPEWQTVASTIPASWSALGTVAFRQYLYFMGGNVNNSPSDMNLSYQAIYTVVLPFIP
jgi:DNA-binding CsgD family transcriptional regulator